jgi:hypothetical protein
LCVSYYNSGLYESNALLNEGHHVHDGCESEPLREGDLLYAGEGALSCEKLFKIQLYLCSFGKSVRFNINACGNFFCSRRNFSRFSYAPVDVAIQ